MPSHRPRFVAGAARRARRGRPVADGLEPGDLADLGRDRLAAHALVHHDEDRVISGDRPERGGQDAPVERRGDDVRAARRRLDDDDGPGARDVDDPLREHPAEVLGGGGGRRRAGGQREGARAAGAAHLDRARAPRSEWLLVQCC